VEYEGDKVDQAELPVADVQAMVERLLSMSVDARLELSWLHPGRADVIGAGGLILSRTLRRTRVSSLVVSEADILEGIAWSLVS
jgi:exopolyphosphatase/guanosine-5'-triphosphate,3'-diphosphate pyrophosphatase